MTKFVLIAEFDVKRGDSMKLLAEVSKEAAASVRAESGCQRFDVLTPFEGEKQGLLYEVYDDEAAYAAHRETPHFEAFFDAISDMEVDWKVAKYQLREG